MPDDPVFTFFDPRNEPSRLARLSAELEGPPTLEGLERQLGAAGYHNQPMADVMLDRPTGANDLDINVKNKQLKEAHPLVKEKPKPFTPTAPWKEDNQRVLESIKNKPMSQGEMRAKMNAPKKVYSTPMPMEIAEGMNFGGLGRLGSMARAGLKVLSPIATGVTYGQILADLMEGAADARMQQAEQGLTPEQYANLQIRALSGGSVPISPGAIY